METSIVSHRVTVRHGRDASVRRMARVLGDAGYEVHTVATDPEAQVVISDSPEHATPADDDFVLGGWVSRTARPWNLAGRYRQKKARRRHMENCNECRRKDVTENEKSGSGDQPPRATKQPVVVVDSGSEGPRALQATVTVEGMSCSSCVGKISEILLEKDWIEKADVSLLTRTATITFYGPGRQQQITELIESAGYDATIEQVQEVDTSSQGKPHEPSSDIWRAELSIVGMSCSSCVGKINETIEKLPWVHSVDVNLLSSSATVVFEDKSHLGELLVIIEDLGFDGKLSDLVRFGQSEDRDYRRTVQIRIDEMYCEHCPDRVVSAMQEMAYPLEILESPTLKMPIMTVSYTPQAPSFTVRTVLDAIRASDPALRPAIHHPPTIEDRAREMHARNRRRLLYRLILAVAAAIPGLIIGIVYMTLVGKNDPNRIYLMTRLSGVPRAEWAVFVLATLVYFFGADIFHRRMLKEVVATWKPGSPVPLAKRFYRFGSMDMLVSFATTIAYFSSIAELIIAATTYDDDMMHHAPEKMPYFDAVIFLTMFLLAGRMIEAYSKAKTGEAVTKLGSLRPKEALLVMSSKDTETENQTVFVPIDNLESGDTVIVVHGASPPWDGILLDKEAEFAEASLTGESRPVMKVTGDEIYSGTVNKGGPITIRIHGAAGESLLDKIIRVVREGQSKRAPIERAADTITGYFVPVVVLFAIVSWLTWLGLGLSGQLPEDYKDVEVGGWPFWSLQFAIAIFVIACPCGIGLAAPTALFVGGGLAAKHGILAKGGGEAFQEASSIDVIVFDKTGTLTEGGELRITNHIFVEDARQEWEQVFLLNSLAEIERNSSHPIAKAIVAFCENQDLRGPKPAGIQEVPGKGMKATFPATETRPSFEMIVGNEALMADHQVAFDEHTITLLDSWKEQAKSVVLVAARNMTRSSGNTWLPTAVFATSDPIREESRSVIETLREQGVDVWMISGDNPKTARAVGAMVSIAPDHIIAGVLPAEKADKVKYLQGSQEKRQRSAFAFGGKDKAKQQRAIVAMVGDGVNDSPALTAADVGIAIGAGSDVAISAAEFVLIKSDLNALLTLVSLSRAVFRRVIFNFGWASVYNLIALPIAAGVLYPIRTNGSYTRLDPVWASLAMALSSVSVICSSLLLKSNLPVVGFRTAPGGAR